MSQEQQPEAHEAPASSPDELVQDLEPRISDQAADSVKGGTQTDQMKQMQDMTNNASTTGQKAAEKSDQYIRS